MPYYAVIDTNVIVSALISKKPDTATVQVFRAMFDGRIIPLYHGDILAEYHDVLHRPKFHLTGATIQGFLSSIQQFGKEVFPTPTGERLSDMDDLVFYEVAMEKRNEDAYLVTGNQKHYPARDFIVTPAEMVAILDSSK